MLLKFETMNCVFFKERFLMRNYIRQNPVAAGVAREIRDGKHIIVMPPFTSDQLVGIPRVIHHPNEMKITSDSSVVTMNDNRNQRILPFVNEIVERVKRDMAAYGFVDNGQISENSIPKMQSGFRDLATQKRLFDEELVKQEGNRALARANVADPSDGPTPHMTGRAVDFYLLIPGTKEIKTSPLSNRKAMWNTRKWKVFDFILVNKYKAMNYEREPWHYEFGEASERNLQAIKRLEAEGKIIGNPKIPSYLEGSSDIDIEAARNYNNRKQTPTPYNPEFDVGSSDFAFYIAHKQKQLGLKADGMMGPQTYAELVKDKNNGGDTPPLIKDLKNIPPTPFDLDKAFDFGVQQPDRDDAVTPPLRRSGSPGNASAQSEAEQRRIEQEIRQREAELQRIEAEKRRIAEEAKRQQDQAREQQRLKELEAERLRVQRELEAKKKRDAEIQAEAKRKKDAEAKRKKEADEAAKALAEKQQLKIKIDKDKDTSIGDLSKMLIIGCSVIACGIMFQKIKKRKKRPVAQKTFHQQVTKVKSISKK